jgi:Tfp pilus assembly protein PilZ
MWNFRFEISCFKPMHEIEKKHQLLYAAYMLFIRGTALFEIRC